MIATHSQSGIMGHQAARYLKQNGKLHLLKGLITIEEGRATLRRLRSHRPTS